MPEYFLRSRFFLPRFRWQRATSPPTARCGWTRWWRFVTSDSGGLDAVTVARHSLRRADADEERGVHRHRRPDAGSRNWREHCDLLRCERRTASAASIPRSGAARAHRDDQLPHWLEVRLGRLSGLRRLAVAKQSLRENRSFLR